MGISELPPDTVRAIGASQALTDSVSVVKELLDNALDARATSVFVEISADTLETIQVRDNGHGIPPQDRLLVARPHCTSKLETFQGLRDIGGASLGFRGEALASVVEMSGALLISTRVEGESVATTLTISRKGEVVAQGRSSLPVGTTVKITNFMADHPVRRQQSLKNADKTLKNAKQMLQAYAFARPAVRVSLRVLKSNNHSSNWTYSSTTGPDIRDAAIKIVGAACASQCENVVTSANGFTLRAFLPRIDADVRKITGFGSFISIDARPVSAVRGMLKNIVKIYRESLKSAGSTFSGVTDAFISLDIQCPPSSYDPNIEPAKDDVLFDDRDTVLSIAKRLFSDFYTVSKSSREDIDLVNRETGLVGEAGLRIRRTALPASSSNPPFQVYAPQLSATHSQDIDECEELPPSSSSRELGEVQRDSSSNMYECDDEYLDLLAPTVQDDHEDRDQDGRASEARGGSNILNPWVIAKMNSSTHHPRPNIVGKDVSGRPTMPSPCPSSALNFSHIPSSSPHAVARIQNKAFNSQRRNSDINPLTPHSLRKPNQRVQGNSTQAQQSNLGTQVPQQRLSKRQVNKPFVSTLLKTRGREKVWFDHVEAIEAQKQAQRNRPTQQSTNARVRDDRLIHSDDSINGFCTESGTIGTLRQSRDMREFFALAHEGPDTSPPALVERRDLHSIAAAGRNAGSDAGFASHGEENFDPSLTSEAASLNESPKATHKRRRLSFPNSAQGSRTDVGARLMETEAFVTRKSQLAPGQRSGGLLPKGLSRRRSSRLALERPPPGSAMQDVSLRISTSIADIASGMANMTTERSSVSQGVLDYQAVGFNCLTAEDIDAVSTNLQRLLRRLLPPTDEIEQDVHALVSRAFKMHGQAGRGDEILRG